MIEEIPRFRYRCPHLSCGFLSDEFEWRSEALAAESRHLEDAHSPIFDDEAVSA